MTLTHEDAIKRAEYIGQIAEETLFEADRVGAYPSKFKDAIFETQLHRLLRPKRYGGFGLGYVFWQRLLAPLPSIVFLVPGWHLSCPHMKVGSPCYPPKGAKKFLPAMNLLRIFFSQWGRPKWWKAA